MANVSDCPECSGKDFKMRGKPIALLNWEKIDNEPVLNIHNFVPVRAWVCQNCGFVKLFYQNPDDVESSSS